MNQKKRYIAVLAAGILLSVGVVAAQTKLGSDRFEDIPAGHWADEAIGWAVDQEIVSGVSATHFGPDQPLTRAQMVTILYRFQELKPWCGGWMTKSEWDSCYGETATTTTTPQAVGCAFVICLRDHYEYEISLSSFKTYVVEFDVGQTCESLYVEVHLERGDRRTGQWGNALVYDVFPGSEVVVEVTFDSDWDTFVWTDSCR